VLDRRRSDLLDANESNWTFADVDDVGHVNNSQVKTLAALVSCVHRRSYCGRIADAGVASFVGERAGAGRPRRPLSRWKGRPHPLRRLGL